MASSISVKVNSPNVTYDQESIRSTYTYEHSKVIKEPNGNYTVKPVSVDLEITTSINLPKLGLMMAGLGGNNATTLIGMILANKFGFGWHTKTGYQRPDFLGSVSQVGTFPIGLDQAGNETFVPIKNMIPIIDPLDLEFDGWDISSMNLGEALSRAAVFEWELQEKLRPLMSSMIPRKAVFCQEFVAANQADRANNLLSGTKQELIEQLRADIHDFKNSKKLDKVIVLWVGNTECYVDIVPGLNDTWENLNAAVRSNSAEISPSTLYALAAIQENSPFINGSPQNTLVPGVIELASSLGIPIAGDDLKTGQTKLKSTLVEYLIGAGLRPESIVSYNHLGNNDGKNLSAPHTFRSKEITKKGVADEMVDMNTCLFPPTASGETPNGPDHLIVIKYVPHVGDSKRALDEYISSIAMGGKNTLVIHNTCEDSLLAAPIMLDLVLFLELFQRIKIQSSEGETSIVGLDMGDLLGYWLKAPITGYTNSLFRQRSCIENLIRAALSLPPTSHLHLDVPVSHMLEESKVQGELLTIKSVPYHTEEGTYVAQG